MTHVRRVGMKWGADLTIFVILGLDPRIQNQAIFLHDGVWLHRHQHGCRQLVWSGEHFDIADAIQREKSLKRWYSDWKIELVARFNPDWQDLCCELW